MKGLAIYTLVVYGLALLGVAVESDSNGVLGMILLIPVVVFAIMYLVKDNKYHNEV